MDGLSELWPANGAQCNLAIHMAVSQKPGTRMVQVPQDTVAGQWIFIPPKMVNR